MSSDKYLIRHEAVIGRTKEDGADHSPIELVFYTVVEATSYELASDLAVQYADKGFKTRVASITSLPDTMSSDKLLILLNPKEVLKEMY